MSVVVDYLEFESAEWGTAHIDRVDLGLLAEFTDLSADECLQRLSTYKPDEMAAAWREADPKTPEEILRFYAETDLYLWELFGWNGSAVYDAYVRRVERLAQLWPPSEHPRALDYGVGIGTAALRLAELGYSVTVADVPGRTLDFARARLARCGHHVDVIEIVDDIPALPSASWDVLVSFDVLEHVPRPDEVAARLVRALKRGGGATLIAPFDWVDARWPHHLPSGRKFSGPRWEMYLRGLGMQQLGDFCYLRTGLTAGLLRRARYLLWRASGLYVEKVPR